MELMKAASIYNGLMNEKEEAVAHFRQSMEKLWSVRPDYHTIAGDIADIVKKEFDVGRIDSRRVKDEGTYMAFVDKVDDKLYKMLGVKKLSGNKVRIGRYVVVKENLEKGDLKEGDLVRIIKAGHDGRIYLQGGTTDDVPIGSIGPVGKLDGKRFTVDVQVRGWWLEYPEVAKVKEVPRLTKKQQESVSARVTEIVEQVEQKHELYAYWVEEDTKIRGALRRFKDVGIEQEETYSVMQGLGLRLKQDVDGEEPRGFIQLLDVDKKYLPEKKRGFFAKILGLGK
ncbi:TPA: hypothetical protein HA265_01135 [Candidatus Woesearchaeota archaeon]|nr:hypothetical protein [Candidatus Woesearchaeota archaeon]